MATEMARLTITMNSEMQPRIDAVKRELFWNKSRGEAIRYLLTLGLEKWEQEKKAQ